MLLYGQHICPLIIHPVFIYLKCCSRVSLLLPFPTLGISTFQSVTTLSVFEVTVNVLYNLLTCLVCCVSPVLPQAPEYLWVTEVTSNSIKLMWNSTSSNATAVTKTPVRSYTVQYQHNGSDDDDIVEVSVRKPEVRLDGLSKQTAYEFHVFAVSDVGRSLSSASTIVTTTASRAGQDDTLFSVICQ